MLRASTANVRVPQKPERRSLVTHSTTFLSFMYSILSIHLSDAQQHPHTTAHNKKKKNKRRRNKEALLIIIMHDDDDAKKNTTTYGIKKIIIYMCSVVYGGG